MDVQTHDDRPNQSRRICRCRWLSDSQYGPDDQDAGIDDQQRERDGFVNLSWLHTIGSRAFLTLSPFYHYNRAAFDGGPNDPIITTDHRASQYHWAARPVLSDITWPAHRPSRRLRVLSA